jgi:catechol 2,3-dioxygenase-like lactoylglutathione lyase family enzyme
MPTIQRLLETALYCDDLDRAVAFYRDVLGFSILVPGPRLTAMDAGGSTVLLLFKKGASIEGIALDDGWIPSHDGEGPVHVAFAIATQQLEGWERRLREAGVSVESRIRWQRGGVSLYFRDPDGHSVELATPGVWETY